jgi:hypothetical protein
MFVFVIPELGLPKHIVFGCKPSSGIHLKEIPAFAGMTKKVEL